MSMEKHFAPRLISFNALMPASFKSDSGAQPFFSGVITAEPMRRWGGRGAYREDAACSLQVARSLNVEKEANK